MSEPQIPLDDPLAPLAQPSTSTAVLEREQVEEQLQEPGDHERFAHYVRKNKIMDSAMSGQPVVAGSSHESLPGIVASARFFLSPSPEEAAEILRQHRVKWVLSDEAGRVASNSAAILGTTVPVNALCLRLEGGGAPVPAFLSFIGRHGSCVLYRVVDPPGK